MRQGLTRRGGPAVREASLGAIRRDSAAMPNLALLVVASAVACGVPVVAY